MHTLRRISAGAAAESNPGLVAREDEHRGHSCRFVLVSMLGFLRQPNLRILS
jgi:hypothetical protein